MITKGEYKGLYFSFRSHTNDGTLSVKALSVRKCIFFIIVIINLNNEGTKNI